MVFNSHHNFSFYCFWSRGLVVARSRTEHKTHGAPAPNYLKIIAISLLVKRACIFSPFQAQVFVSLFMFYKRKKLINLFPKETQVCAYSHLNFAEGEFLTTVVWSPWRRTGTGRPAPDVCWIWAVPLSWGPLGDPRGTNLLVGGLHLVGNRTHRCQEDFFSVAQILSGIVLWLRVMARAHSS